MGIERILYFIEKEGISLPEKLSVKLYVGVLGEEARAASFKIVTELRNKGITVETDYLNRSVKAQMKYANKIGAEFSVIIGQNEIENRIVTIKDMRGDNNREVSLSELADCVMNL